MITYADYNDLFTPKKLHTVDLLDFQAKLCTITWLLILKMLLTSVDTDHKGSFQARHQS